MPLSFLDRKADTSWAGRLNIRTKLMLCLASSLAAIVLSNPQSLALLCLASMVYALTALSPWAMLKAYSVFVLMCLVSLGFMSLVSLVMPQLVVWESWRFAVPYMRMLLSFNALLVLAFSSRIQEVMRELQSFGRMVWLHVPLTVAVRFLPTFLDDCAQIRDAYRLRQPLGGQGFRARISSVWRGFLVPLTFRLLGSADDLSVAAELKGVGNHKRLARKAVPFGRSDILALGLCTLGLALAVCLQAIQGGGGIWG